MTATSRPREDAALKAVWHSNEMKNLSNHSHAAGTMRNSSESQPWDMLMQNANLGLADSLLLPLIPDLLLL